MRKILLTGLIGSGKSAVSAILRKRGFAVYDSDSRTKALYESVPGLVERIEEAIGVPFSEVRVIFSDSAKREALEAIVYPEVLEDFRKYVAGFGENPVFFESAVAYSKPLFRNEFDSVVLVRAPYEIRLGRNPKVAERAASQVEMPEDEADYIIDNVSGLSELEDQVDRMIKDLKI